MRTSKQAGQPAPTNTAVAPLPAPSYPAVRVFWCFTGLGGAVGGGLISVFVGVSVLLRDGDLWPHWLSFTLIAMLYGSAIGLLPATLCGLWLAWRRRVRSAAGVLEAVAVGMGLTFAGMWLISHAVAAAATLSLVGGGSALLLAWAVLPSPSWRSGVIRLQ